MLEVNKVLIASAFVSAVALVACATQPPTPANPMSFFVTSSNPGKGADLGGLAGADVTT